MKHTFFALTSLLSLVAVPAQAQLTLEITGSPSSSLVTFTASGSSVYSGSGGLQTPSISHLYAMDSVLVSQALGVHPFSNGSIVVNNDSTGSSLALDAITLEKNPFGNGHDRVGVINSMFIGQLYWPGEALSWSGSAEFDLATVGLTWADFHQGTHASVDGLFGFDAAEPMTLIIEEESAFADFCNGDGGDQMGCTDCPCGNNAAVGTIGGCVNSAGSSARLNATGDTSVSLALGATTDLRFHLIGAPASAFCILNSGDAVAPQSMANPCFGANSGAQSMSFDGLRCAVQNTQRHGGRAADANGDVGISNNPWGGEGAPPLGLAQAFGGFSAGQSRYYQVINRDDPLLNCMRGLNTSQSVEVTFTP